MNNSSVFSIVDPAGGYKNAGGWVDFAVDELAWRKFDLLPSRYGIPV